MGNIKEFELIVNKNKVKWHILSAELLLQEETKEERILKQ
jgi:hypothetical protein